jgi:hypothetical protein
LYGKINNIGLLFLGRESNVFDVHFSNSFWVRLHNAPTRDNSLETKPALQLGRINKMQSFDI